MNMHDALMRSAAPVLLIVPLLGGCSLEAAVATCAQCGEVRAIVAREVRADIRLLTDAPRTVSTRSTAPIVYDVRVRMDRGGSRDFVLDDRRHLRIGDRVEIRDGKLVPVARDVGLGLT